MRTCLWVLKNFLVILSENDGGNGGMEVPVGEFKGVKRSVRWEMKKKKKKEMTSEEPVKEIRG